MDDYLQRLMQRIPPPTNVPDRDVDWSRLEAAVNLTYPVSFKDFIGVYGRCVWFDHICPLFTTARSDADLKQFRQSVDAKLKPVKANTRDKRFKKIDVSVYPSQGGLFPFMVDYSSSLYCWQTDQSNPNAWSIVCWFTGQLVVLENTTIPKMILDWLERNPVMVNLWGDYTELPPDRIRITEPSESKA
jgi:hypothetical protein